MTPEHRLGAELLRQLAAGTLTANICRELVTAAAESIRARDEARRRHDAAKSVETAEAFFLRAWQPRFIAAAERNRQDVAARYETQEET